MKIKIHNLDGTETITGEDATPVVPSSITRVQTMKQLKVLGKWLDFKAVVASNQDAQDEWELATELHRDHVFIDMLAPIIGMTSADVDALFIEASKL